MLGAVHGRMPPRLYEGRTVAYVGIGSIATGAVLGAIATAALLDPQGLRRQSIKRSLKVAGVIGGLVVALAASIWRR